MNDNSQMLDTYQQNWNNPLVVPWSIFEIVFNRLSYKSFILSDYLNMVVFFVFVLLMIYGIRKIHPAMVIYSIVTFGLVVWISLGRLSTQPQDGQILASLIRYVVTLFPVFLILGKLTRRLDLFIVFMTLFISVQLLLGWLFLQWYWVA
jgi:hypothetical protein